MQRLKPTQNDESDAAIVSEADRLLRDPNASWYERDCDMITPPFASRECQGDPSGSKQMVTAGVETKRWFDPQAAA